MSSLRKKLFVCSMLCLMLYLSPIRGEACSCGRRKPITPCEAYGRASAVFVGRFIQGSRKIETENAKKGETDITYSGELLFEVIESFTNGLEKSIRAESGSRCCSGPDAFKLGESYLVYLYQSEDGKLITAGTTKSMNFPKAMYSAIEDQSIRELLEREFDPETDLEFLRHLPQQSSGVKLYGEILSEYLSLDPKPNLVSEPLQDVAIKIKGEGEVFEIKTDNKGRYELGGIKPGRYQIEVAEPKGYATSSEAKVQTEEFLVRDCGCWREDFWFEPGGQISGQVVDEKGNPIPNVYVDVISADWQTRQFTGEAVIFGAETDGEGRYRIRKLPPGRYLVGENLSDSSSFLRTFYPAGSDIMQATAVVVGFGEKVTNVNLTLSNH